MFAVQSWGCKSSFVHTFALCAAMLRGITHAVSYYELHICETQTEL